MFDKAMKKSIEPHLQSGEELLNVIIVQGKGMMKWMVGGGALGAAAAGAMKDRKARTDAEANGGEGVQLASKMGLAITSQRLLIFKAGGAVTLKATELLTEAPIAEVDSVEVGKGAVTKPVMLTLRGETVQVDAPRAVNTDKFVEAFNQAKAGSPALT